MRIVKCKHGRRAEMEAVPGFVYCGRAFGGFDESPLCNPYRVGEKLDLVTSLQMYREYLWRKLQHADYLHTVEHSKWTNEDKQTYKLARTLEGLKEDSVLGCWCCNKEVAGEGPEQCHCDVIAKAWRWLKRG